MCASAAEWRCWEAARPFSWTRLLRLFRVRPNAWDAATASKEPDHGPEVAVQAAVPTRSNLPEREVSRPGLELISSLPFPREVFCDET